MAGSKKRMGLRSAKSPRKHSPLYGVVGIALLVSVVITGTSYAQGNPTPEPGSRIPDHYIVVLKSSTTGQDTEEVGNKYGVSFDHRYDRALKGFAARLTAAQVAGLREDPRVQLVEEDLVMGIDAPIQIAGQKAPTANFSATPRSGNVPLTVTFTDSSGRGASSWAWDFENDGIVDSTLKNPTHVYSAAGVYSVKLTATNGGGSSSKLQTNYITVGDPAPDPGPGDCNPVENGTQHLPWGVNRIDAEQNAAWATCDGGNGVGVAIFDTGIDLDHPDLVDGIVASVDFTGKGTAEDGHGHGTHVAGIVGARRNAVGYVGVAPKADLIAIKVLSDSGSGSTSNIIAGVNWAITNKATYNIKVGNMSLGAAGTSSSLETAINNAAAAGIVIVAAAGNGAVDANTYIPAKFANVVTVSASTSSDAMASYSNWGTAIDLIAPGSSITSTYKNGAYATMSGTSMAAPHVAGALALWFDDHSGSFSQAKAALEAVGLPGPWTGDPDGIAEPMVYALPL